MKKRNKIDIELKKSPAGSEGESPKNTSRSRMHTILLKRNAPTWEKVYIRRPTFEDDIYSAKGGQKSMSIINSTEYSIIRRNIRCVITENLNAKSTSVTALWQYLAKLEIIIGLPSLGNKEKMPQQRDLSQKAIYRLLYTPPYVAMQEVENSVEKMLKNAVKTWSLVPYCAWLLQKMQHGRGILHGQTRLSG